METLPCPICKNKPKAYSSVVKHDVHESFEDFECASEICSFEGSIDYMSYPRAIEKWNEVVETYCIDRIKV